jgi:hypothetical protein
MLVGSSGNHYNIYSNLNILHFLSIMDFRSNIDTQFSHTIGFGGQDDLKGKDQILPCRGKKYEKLLLLFNRLCEPYRQAISYKSS